jgi:primase-polymerase (primpol)-like protein
MTVLAPNPGGVPLYLTNLPRWLLWRIEQRISRKTGETEETKPPISYHTGKHCDVTDPRNWTDFINVQSALGKSHACDGFGIALGEIPEHKEILIGLDADNCLDEDDAIAPWAMEFLIAMASYADRSPGGAGLKCLARIPLADLHAARKLT